MLSSGHNSPAQCRQPSASRRKLPHSRVPILQMPRLTDGSSFKLPWDHPGVCQALVLGLFRAETTRHSSCYADFLPWNPCKCTSEAPRTHLPPTLSAAVKVVTNFRHAAPEETSDRCWATLVPGASNRSVLLRSGSSGSGFRHLRFWRGRFAPHFLWCLSRTDELTVAWNKSSCFLGNDHVAMCVLFWCRGSVLSLGGAHVSCLPRIPIEGGSYWASWRAALPETAAALR